MTRRHFIGVTSGAGIGIWTGGCAFPGEGTSRVGSQDSSALDLLPFPQRLCLTGGSLRLGVPQEVRIGKPSSTEALGMESLRRHLPADGPPINVRLGSVEEGYDAAWLTVQENDFISGTPDRPESSVVVVDRTGVTVVGRDRWGMLYGVQTICQLAVAARREKREAIPCLRIRDWPDLQWRCLAPTLDWYSGWNRLEGYDICNWSEGEWKWLADWSLLHKCNAWAVCMYGYWPFTLPGYPEETLDVDSFFYNPATRKKEPRRFVHPNIRKEFYPRVIQYANQRGIKVHAYIGKNSFNGCHFRENAALYAGGAAELLPFAPGVDQYWEAFIARILEMGFNGFVFEDPEANHVPNQNQRCYETFWQPWAEKYGYSSVKQTDANHPPLGVHIEYYAWLYRQFAEKIGRHARRLRRRTEIYLISHVLLARMMSESKSERERREWIDLIDRKHGERVRFVIAESNEKAYVDLLGGDRVASLGGRGGSCTCAMRRIASVNNNWLNGGMGGDLAYERECQNRIVQAGGFGAMGYIFEWTNTEVFGYLAAQHLWNHSGIPGVNGTDQTGFLEYAYRLYYGAETGQLVARAMDEGSDINDAMVLEGVYGSQYPSTGKALHRDYQFLAVLADHAEKLARQAYRSFTGREPDLFQPVYNEEEFQWDGYDPARDRLFKEERLRKLWISTRRSQEMCGVALAHRKAQRLMAAGAPAAAVLKSLNEAVDRAALNQLIYQVNYDDDYDDTDGLCYKVTEHLEKLRDEVLAESLAADRDRPVSESIRKKAEPPVLYIPWTKLEDLLPSREGTPGSGLCLQTRIGLVAREDFFRLGVVFTVEVYEEASGWTPLFRRSVQRRTRQWEEWRIPLPLAAGKNHLRLRFVTDSYSRAQDRNAPTWKWALWGDPRLVEARGAGSPRVVYDFGRQVDSAQALVRLDKDGKDRVFDNKGEDSTGATFKLLEPEGLARRLEKLRREKANWQWLDGFAEWSGAAPAQGDYRSYLGTCPSRWTYGEGAVSWLTAAAKKRRDTAIVFAGSSDFVASGATLRASETRFISFQTGLSSDQHWDSGDVELFYFHGATIPGHGISGVYVVLVPASAITAGKPIELSVRMAKPGGWIMCQGYGGAMEAILNPLPLPGPAATPIAAFTPHRDGQFGLTIGEYSVPL
jgi:hypothetical protein